MFNPIWHAVVNSGNPFEECESFYRAATLCGAEFTRLAVVAVNVGLTNEPSDLIDFLTS